MKADVQLALLLLGGLVAVLGAAQFPATRLPWSWLASIILVRLAVVAPQTLTFLSWQPWFLTAAIIGLVGAFVTLVLMYHWVLQGKRLTVPPGTPPLFFVFSAGIVLSSASTGDLALPVPPMDRYTVDPEWRADVIAFLGMGSQDWAAVRASAEQLWNRISIVNSAQCKAIQTVNQRADNMTCF